jgi:hypothetical protein
MIYKRGFLACPLDALFSNGTRVAVLRVLHDKHEPIAGRAVARMAQVNHQAAANALKSLQRLKVVRGTADGRWILERRNILGLDLVQKTFKTEAVYVASLVDTVRNRLAGTADGAFFFGAAALGKLAPGGTLHLAAVVGRKGRAPLAEAVRGLSTDIRQVWGLELDARVLSAEDARLLSVREEAWRLLPDEGPGWNR